MKNSIKDIEEEIVDEFNLHSTIKGKKAILFSPGCSSFDQYKNFEERGNSFNSLVHELFNES